TPRRDRIAAPHAMPLDTSAAQARDAPPARRVPSVMAGPSVAPGGGASSALGLEHRPGAVLRPAAAGPQLLELGRARLVEDDAVVVGQLLAGADVAQREDVHLVLVASVLVVFLDLGLAVRIAAVVHPAGDVAVHVGVDHVLVVEREQEGVPVLVLVAVLLVHLVVGPQRALVADD